MTFLFLFLLIVLVTFSLENPSRFLNPDVPSIQIFSDQLPAERLAAMQAHVVTKVSILLYIFGPFFFFF